jgi:hypothetical protein
MTTELQTAWDVAEEAERRAWSFSYPEMPKAPKREDYKTGREYGRAVGDYEDAKEAVTAQRRAWEDGQTEAEQWFKTELARALRLEGHPKFDALYRIAWQEGHSSGFSEVANYADTLAELLREDG